MEPYGYPTETAKGDRFELTFELDTDHDTLYIGDGIITIYGLDPTLTHNGKTVLDLSSAGSPKRNGD